jgi:hypothetical protein
MIRLDQTHVTYCWVNPEHVAALTPRHKSEGGGTIIHLCGKKSRTITVINDIKEVRERMKWKS